MKKLLFALALVPFLFASCGPKTKTVQMADFSITYPSSYEILYQKDGYPEDAQIYFQGENGQIAMNTIVYYSDKELDYVDDLHNGLDNFYENKILELLNNLIEGNFESAFPGLEIDDFDEIEWNDDKSVAWLYFEGTMGEQKDPYFGGITIYLSSTNALVKLLGICNNEEEYEEMEQVMLNIDFAEAE